MLEAGVLEAGLWACAEGQSQSQSQSQPQSRLRIEGEGKEEDEEEEEGEDEEEGNGQEEGEDRMEVEAKTSWWSQEAEKERCERRPPLRTEHSANSLPRDGPCILRRQRSQTELDLPQTGNCIANNHRKLVL